MPDAEETGPGTELRAAVNTAKVYLKEGTDWEGLYGSDLAEGGTRWLEWAAKKLAGSRARKGTWFRAAGVPGECLPEGGTPVAPQDYSSVGLVPFVLRVHVKVMGRWPEPRSGDGAAVASTAAAGTTFKGAGVVDRAALVADALRLSHPYFLADVERASGGPSGGDALGLQRGVRRP